MSVTVQVQSPKRGAAHWVTLRRVTVQMSVEQTERARCCCLWDLVGDRVYEALVTSGVQSWGLLTPTTSE